MALEARGDLTYEELQRASDTLVYYASQRKELARVSSSMQGDIPKLYYDVDRDRAKLLGVSVSDLFTTMKAFTGSVYVNDFNLFNRVYRVYIQAEEPYRQWRDDMNMYFVRGNGGAMIPVTSIGTTEYTTGPGTIKRFNMYYAATITGERPVLPGKAAERSDRTRPGLSLPLRLPLLSRPVRELVGTHSSHPVPARGMYRSLPVDSGLRHGE